MRVTKRLTEVLAFMRQYHAEYDNTPTMRTICERFGWSSANSAEECKQRLIVAGELESLGTGLGYRFKRKDLKMSTYYEQRGRMNYEAYTKKAIEIDEEGLAGHALKFDDLDAGTKQCWCAAADAINADALAPFAPSAIA